MESRKNMESEDLIPISYLIKYKELDILLKDIVSENTTTILYFDVKNVLVGIHSDEEIENIVEQFQTNIDKTKVAKTIICLANHYARYFNKKQVPYHLVFFDDRGISNYHYKISKVYKQNRDRAKMKLSEVFLDNNKILENFTNIYDKNISILSSMFKHMNNVSYVNVTNIESDFIPYFLIKEDYIDQETNQPDKQYNHIIVGNDKDFTQLLITHNIYQIRKIAKKAQYEILSKFNAMEGFLKNKDKVKSLKDARFIPLLLAIAGDNIDCVYGIDNVGYITAYNIINELYENKIILLSDHTAEKFLFKLKEYVKISSVYGKSVIIKKILSNEEKILNNYKLVSFKALYDSLSYIEKSNIKNIYKKVVENKVTKQSLHYNLSRICVFEGSYKNLLLDA